MKYHCIGDSHIGVLDQGVHGDKCSIDLSKFVMHPLGPTLAYNFVEGSDSYETAKKIIEEITEGDAAIICLGEIDMRCHVLKQCDIQKKPFIRIVNEIGTRYVNSIKKLCETGRKIFILAPCPIINNDIYTEYDSKYYHYELSVLRNFASIHFNRYLKNNYDMTISVMGYVLKKDLSPDDTYYYDGIHLNEKAIPEIIEQIDFLQKVDNAIQ